MRRWGHRSGEASDAADMAALLADGAAGSTWPAPQLAASLGAGALQALCLVQSHRQALETLGAEGMPPICGLAIWRQVLDEWQVEALAVGLPYRRQGGAWHLMQALLSAHRVKGGRRVSLEVAACNAPARALYRRLGFAEVGWRRGYYRNGDDACLLLLTTPPRLDP